MWFLNTRTYQDWILSLYLLQIVLSYDSWPNCLPTFTDFYLDNHHPIQNQTHSHCKSHQSPSKPYKLHITYIYAKSPVSFFTYNTHTHTHTRSRDIPYFTKNIQHDEKANLFTRWRLTIPGFRIYGSHYIRKLKLFAGVRKACSTQEQQQQQRRRRRRSSSPLSITKQTPAESLPSGMIPAVVYVCVNANVLMKETIIRWFAWVIKM